MYSLYEHLEFPFDFTIERQTYPRTFKMKSFLLKFTVILESLLQAKEIEDELALQFYINAESKHNTTEYIDELISNICFELVETNIIFPIRR